MSSQKSESNKAVMDYPNETAFESVRHTATCGKYVVVCNGEILAHYDDIMSAVLYTREEIKHRKFAIVIFTRLPTQAPSAL